MGSGNVKPALHSIDLYGILFVLFLALFCRSPVGEEISCHYSEIFALIPLKIFSMPRVNMVLTFIPDLKGTVDPMVTHVKISPVTRIEGHLAIDLKVESNQVVQAFSSGEMFRGLEVLLKGRDPLDAHQIVQRICGVCPVSHGTASIYAQDQAYNVTIPSNGRLLRNLILGANYIQSHILHFYHLTALDYVDVTAITGYQGSDPDLELVRN